MHGNRALIQVENWLSQYFHFYYGACLESISHEFNKNLRWI